MLSSCPALSQASLLPTTSVPFHVRVTQYDFITFRLLSPPSDLLHTLRGSCHALHVLRAQPFTTFSTVMTELTSLSRVMLASPSNNPSQPQPKSLPPRHSSSSSSYVLDIRPPPQPPLLDVATPIRSMVWAYMDDRSAIQYLSTCRSLHRIYHSYPLKQLLTVGQFSRAEYMNNRVNRYSLWLACLAGYLCKRPLPRFGCCDRDGITNRPMSGLMRSTPSSIPRVTFVVGTVRSSLLPYLKHIEEADVADDSSLPIGPHNPLPHSLRTLRLHDSPKLTLKPNTLPSRLTSLTLGRLKSGAQLRPGVLPHSLVSLHLTGEFNTRSPIAQGVLPPTLKRLEVDEWKLPLSDLAMPASLVHLRVHMLNSDTIQPGTLPPNLEVLQLEGFFDQPHPISAGVLPSSLRVLHLMGCYSQRFTYKTFGALQQLEELHLSHHYSHPLQPHLLPASLRVLRLGTLWEPVRYDALPPYLERLMVRIVDWRNVERYLTLLHDRAKREISIEIDLIPN